MRAQALHAEGAHRVQPVDRRQDVLRLGRRGSSLRLVHRLRSAQELPDRQPVEHPSEHHGNEEGWMQACHRPHRHDHHDHGVDEPWQRPVGGIPHRGDVVGGSRDEVGGAGPLHPLLVQPQPDRNHLLPQAGDDGREEGRRERLGGAVADPRTDDCSPHRQGRCEQRGRRLAGVRSIDDPPSGHRHRQIEDGSQRHHDDGGDEVSAHPLRGPVDLSADLRWGGQWQPVPGAHDNISR